MKKINMIMMGLMLGASSLYAQPGSVQKLAKSVFTLTTFNQKGDIIASTQGVLSITRERLSAPSNHLSEL